MSGGIAVIGDVEIAQEALRVDGVDQVRWLQHDI